MLNTRGRTANILSNEYVTTHRFAVPKALHVLNHSCADFLENPGESGEKITHIPKVCQLCYDTLMISLFQTLLLDSKPCIPYVTAPTDVDIGWLKVNGQKAAGRNAYGRCLAGSNPTHHKTINHYQYFLLERHP